MYFSWKWTLPLQRVIEEKYEDIYEDFELDFTFGGKGFTIIESDEDTEILHSYSRQKGYQNFDGLGWILIVHTNMGEILRDVNSQRDNLILITIAMTSIAAILGVFFARIFYRQSNRINENQKMVTIGQLSSNIAHDMRNPLGAIRSSTERIKHDSKVKKCKNDIDAFEMYDLVQDPHELINLYGMPQFAEM